MPPLQIGPACVGFRLLCEKLVTKREMFAKLMIR